MKNKIVLILCIFLLIFSLFTSISLGVSGPDAGWFDSHDSSLLDYMLVIQKYYNDNNLTLYHYIICDDGYIYTFSRNDFSCYVDSSRFFTWR